MWTSAMKMIKWGEREREKVWEGPPSDRSRGQVAGDLDEGAGLFLFQMAPPSLLLGFPISQGWVEPGAI